MDKETLNTHAMQMILHAGNARNELNMALKDIENNREESCDSHMEEARREITLAHSEQTKVLQNTIQEDLQLTILFTHAQDTLMTVVSEINTGKYLIKIMKRINVL